MKKRYFLALGSIGTIASVILPISCGSNGNDGNISDADSYEGQITFLDNVFNSNYLQNILLQSTYSDVNKEKISAFIKEHKMYENLQAKTQHKIDETLNNIEVINTRNAKKITLNIDDVVFEHQLVKQLQAPTYQFDKQNKEVIVQVDQITSFQDIFEVFSDIWNLKPKYDNLTKIPHSLLKNFNWPQTEKWNNPNYLKNKMILNSVFSDIYTYNFDYKIVFQNSSQETFIFDNHDNKKNLASIIDLTRVYNELYNFENLTTKLPADYYENNQYSHYEIYPIMHLNNDQIGDFENSILTFYSLLPQNSYVYYNKIFNNLFNNFATFWQSNFFKEMIKKPDFNSEISIYEFDKTSKTVIAKPYLEQKYDSFPLGIPSANVVLPDNRSYLEYMFAQYIYNADLFTSFKNIELENDFLKNVDFQISNNEIVVKDTNFENFSIYEQKISDFSAQDKNKTKSINLKVRANYGYFFAGNIDTNLNIGIKVSDNNKYLAHIIENEYLMTDSLLNIYDSFKIEDSSPYFFQADANLDEIINFEYNQLITNLLNDAKISIEQISQTIETIIVPTEITSEVAEDGKKHENKKWKAKEQIAITLLDPDYWFALKENTQKYYATKIMIEINYTFLTWFTQEVDNSLITYITSLENKDIAIHI